MEVTDGCKRKRKLNLKKEVEAFKEHPEESGEMKVSENDVAYTPDLNN